ncbi:hypothetical protein [Micromonospora sp. KC213]|uniref:hypothetical protein n=1 Tax=Micromonospora sp. KC213 TaxID=2530378 RepID=UPI001051E9D2|nr:hypothetical protein [Micromonospora sp. KC213]TDC38050.1 hypothetical protein E1166_19110 [Micromonospora sp. KC213]
MHRKPWTTRTALITTAAMTTGSAAGAAVDAAASHLGHPGLGIGQVATAITAVWMLEKLNSLIDDTK